MKSLRTQDLTGILLLVSVLSGVTVSLAASDSESGVAQGRVIDGPGAVLPERQRVDPVNDVLRYRLEEMLPGLMRSAGLDMWVLINREYAEDPAYFTLVPEPVFAARRTTMLVFFDRGPETGVERLTVSRYPLAGLYEPAWEGGDLSEQWLRLAEVIEERQPKQIGINTSMTWPVADGLTASLREELEKVLSSELRRRLVSAEDLVIRWLETRSAKELEFYPHVVSLARGVISEAFSSQVITPGITTTEDVAWFIRQRFSDLGLQIWFMPDVDVQRAGESCEADSPFCGSTDGVILPGDALHTDVGICYLRLCTDTQEMGYVLRTGERMAPAGLTQALAVGNLWQDLLIREFRSARTGNEILAAAQSAIQEAGISASIYSHPIGYFGHAPGPTIGMWDNQGPTPGRGDWLLSPDTAYAIEGNVKVAVPEWGGQLIQIKLEQSAVFDGESVYYLAGRQTEWHLVR